MRNYLSLGLFLLIILPIFGNCQDESQYILFYKINPPSTGYVLVNGEKSEASAHEPDSSVTLKAVGRTGYVFDHWEGDSSETVNQISITMNDNKLVYAYFVEDTTVVPDGDYTVSTSASPTNGGTIDLSPAGGSYDDGTELTVTANPASGYEFDHWEGDLSGNTNPESITVDSDKNVTAVFLAIPEYTLDVTISPSSTGTVDLVPSGGVYSEGTNVNLTANPAVGYIFSHWEGDLTGAASNEVITMDSDKSVTAVFTPELDWNISITVNPPGAGTVDLAPVGGTYTDGTNVTLTASENYGYIFDHWEGDLTGSTNPDSITMDSDKAVTAVFTPVDWNLTVNVNPPGAGTVGKVPDQATYAHTANVELTANANTGYVFDHWEDDLTGNTNPENLTMDADKTVTAVFVSEEWNLSININPLGAGTVNKNPDQATYTHGSSVQLTANASSGYVFDHWEDDLTGSTNPDNLTMDSDKTVTAVFVANNVNLTASSVNPSQTELLINGRNDTNLARGTFVHNDDYIDYSLDKGPYRTTEYASPTSFNVSATIQNNGSQNCVTAFVVRLYLSRDTTLDTSGTIFQNDVQLGSDKNIASLAASSSTNISWTSLTVPWDWEKGADGLRASMGEGGEAYLIVDVDATDAVTESFETDNEIQSGSTLDLQREFATWDMGTNAVELRRFQKIGAGNNTNVWMCLEDEDSDGETASDEISTLGGGSAIIDELENTTNIFGMVTSKFIGSTADIYDMDNNGKVEFLCYDILSNGTSPDAGAYTGGFFWSIDAWPDNTDSGCTALQSVKDNWNPNYISNMSEVCHMDTENPASLGSQFGWSTLSHEFQHMLNFHQNAIVDGTGQMATWLNEAMSMTAEHYVHGKDSSVNSRIYWYNNCHEGGDTSACPADPVSYKIGNGRGLLTWGYPANVLYDYSYKYLFGVYLYYQASASPSDGDASIFKALTTDTDANEVLAAVNASQTYSIIGGSDGWDELLQQFHIARALNKTSGKYGFKNQLNTGVTYTLNAATDSTTGTASQEIYPGGAIFRTISSPYSVPTGSDGSDAGTDNNTVKLSFTTTPTLDTTDPLEAGRFLVYHNGTTSGDNGYDNTGGPLPSMNSEPPEGNTNHNELSSFAIEEAHKYILRQNGIPESLRKKTERILSKHER